MLARNGLRGVAPTGFLHFATDCEDSGPVGPGGLAVRAGSDVPGGNRRRNRDRRILDHSAECFGMCCRVRLKRQLNDNTIT